MVRVLYHKRLLVQQKQKKYNSGDVVRLTATPDTGWVFNSWSGSSTQTTNEIDVAIDGTKSVTATFEEQISNVLQDGVFLGVGKWKIRKNIYEDLKNNADVAFLKLYLEQMVRLQSLQEQQQLQDNLT